MKICGILVQLGIVLKENVDDASEADMYSKEGCKRKWCLAESLTRTNYRMLLIKIVKLLVKDNTSANKGRWEILETYSKGKVVIAGAGCGALDLM